MLTEREFKKALSRHELLETVVTCFEELDTLTETEAVLRRVASMAVDAVTASWAKVWVKESDGRGFYTYGETHHPVRILPDSGILGRSIRKKTPFLINDIDEIAFFDPEVDNIASLPVKGMMVVPILSREDEAVMVIQAVITRKDLHQFVQSDMRVLQTIAGYVGRFHHRLERRSMQIEEDEALLRALETQQMQSEAALEARTHFLAEVAHDIRTPMNAVMGFIDLLRADESDPAKARYLDNAAQSGEMMTALINDLLDFSKIESGMMHIDEKPFCPMDAFGSISALFCGKILQKQIRFSNFIDPALPAVIASDPFRIKQVLTNLLSNAVKFTPEGGRISLEIRYDGAADAITFSVEDTGIGIDEAKQKTIFDAYAQETSSTAEAYGGTGLGLSISMKLTRMLGTRLELQSEKGRGSCFYFMLPLSDDLTDRTPALEHEGLETLTVAIVGEGAWQEDLERYLRAFGVAQIRRIASASGVPASATHCFTATATDALPDAPVKIAVRRETSALPEGWRTLSLPLLPKELFETLRPPEPEDEECDSALQERRDERILIVDDNAINVQFLKEVVEKLGISSESSLNGMEAVEAYRGAMQQNRPYALILMDEKMPMMSGTDAAKAIGEIEKAQGYAHTPIIGTSGNATQEQRERSLASGIDACLFKPISVKKMSEVFCRYVGSVTA